MTGTGSVAQLLKELRQHQVVLRLDQEKLLCELPKQGIPAALRESLIARKEELKSYIASMVSEQPVLAAIQRRPRRQAQVPLSSAQRRLWLMDQIDGSSAHTNMSYALSLWGELNYAAINYALQTIIERHQVLRTNFLLDDEGQPYQMIQDAPEFAVAIKDLSALSERALQLTVAEQVNHEAMRRFDLRRDLTLHTQLLKISPENHIMLVTMHHVASDGWSMAIVVSEFSELYSAHVENRDAHLPPLDIQYVDYALWQYQWLQSEALDHQLTYWKQQLADLPLVHSLPLDYPRPKVQRLEGKKFQSSISTETLQTLSALCQSQGATLFMGLQAAFALLLARYSNEYDVVMGSLIANREQTEIAGLIGCFFNVLVLRNDLSNNPNFIELLQQSKKMLLDAYANQQVPFEQILETLQPERSLAHNPLFQILLIMQNTEIGTLQLPGLELGFVEQERNHAAYDLRLEIIESGEQLKLNWEYKTDLFHTETIQRMAQHFEFLLDASLANPETNVFSLNMQSHAERQKLLTEWNNTGTDYPAEQCIHERFEAQVELTPEAIAVVFNDQHIKYADLNAQANQLAHYLRKERNVTLDSLVGVCVESSVDMMVAILAILKAGAAYVPLDSNYPEARLSYMIGDAQLATVITHKHLLNSTPISLAQALCLDDAFIQQQLSCQSNTNISAQHIGLAENHLAYVIYTSGSTGNPKGVAVERKGVRNLIHWYLREYGFNHKDIFFIVSAIGFDLTQKNLFAPITSGGRLVLYSHDYFDPDIALNNIRTNAVTVINCAPSVFYSLIQSCENNAYDALKSVRYVLLGGEPINTGLVKPWLQHGSCKAQIINMYGPTECTDITTRHHHQPESKGTHIGGPIDNVSLYVLNTAHQLAAMYVPGELCIGGASLARGYLNRPELTAEKFIRNPFYEPHRKNSSEHLYRTGDLVRWLPGGKIEFLGRIDHQVKIRGLRIELGEIENALTSLESIKDALVMPKHGLVKAGTYSETCLVAYVATDVAQENVGGDAMQSAQYLFIERLRQQIAKKLPDYMVPSIFILLPDFPLTPNGKIDRKALPEPEFSNKKVAYIAPQTETEKLICNVLQEVMGVGQVGVADDFFLLGGNSLLAVKIMSRINRDAKVNLSLKSFLTDTCVAGVARLIDILKLAEANMTRLADDELAEEGFF